MTLINQNSLTVFLLVISLPFIFTEIFFLLKCLKTKEYQYLKTEQHTRRHLALLILMSYLVSHMAYMLYHTKYLTPIILFSAGYLLMVIIITLHLREERLGCAKETEI